MGGGNNYIIIRTPFEKNEFDRFVINSDLNGNLELDFNNRKLNSWNYVNYGHGIFDTSTFQNNTNNTSTRFYWYWQYGISYSQLYKDTITNPDPKHIVFSTNLRPIFEYRD